MSNKLSYSEPLQDITLKETKIQLPTPTSSQPPQPIPKSSWSHLTEIAAKDIGERSQGYKIMHIKSSYKSKLTYDYIMYTCIILGPLSGLISGIGVTLNPNAPTTMPIISSVIAFVSGILIAVTKFGKFEEEASAHKLAASKYTSLESNIRRQLAMSRTTRIDPGQYLEYIGKSYEDIFLASPLLPKGIYNNYIQNAKLKGLCIPDEYGDTININENYEQIKLKEMATNEKINVNNMESKDEHSVFISKNPSIKGKKKVRRNSDFSNYPELNQYDDKQMAYEIKRMLNYK